MKTKTQPKLIVALFAMIFGFNAFGQLSPYVGVNITVVPVLLPAQNMASSWETRARFQEDYLGGTLSRTNEGYTVITNGVIGWKDLDYVEGAETGWKVLQQLIIVRSKDGGDNISLSMLRVSATSTGGALNSTYQVGTFGYSDIVFGVHRDGSRVTSGDPNQMVAILAITTQMSLFNGGSTQAGLDQVQAYVMGQPNFAVTYRVTMAGDTESVGTTTVSIRVPELEWVSTGIRLVGDSTDHPYDLLATDHINGEWTKITTIHPGEIWPVNKTAPARFFRAVLSP